MSLQLAAHLVHTAVVPREQIVRDLVEALGRDAPLLDVLRERDERLIDQAERSLQKLGHPAILAIRPVPELCEQLPVGLCRRLLALPVRRDPRTGLVDVAAVDPLDSHVAEELGFHLNLPVRILRAPYRELLQALAGLDALAERRQRARERGSSRSGQGASPKTLRMQTRPRPNAPSIPPAPETRPVDGERGEWRAIWQALAKLEVANAPREVVAALAGASGPELGTLLVFVAREGHFELKGGGVVSRPSGLVMVDATQPSVLSAACKSPYQGSLPATSIHRPIYELLPQSAVAEIYARAVHVGTRVALVLLAAGFERAELARKLADRMAENAGRVLTQFVLAQREQSDAER